MADPNVTMEQKTDELEDGLNMLLWQFKENPTPKNKKALKKYLSKAGDHGMRGLEWLE